ncbi:hypothetical protein Pyrde_0009 [Pyrodictium delaneyi]|uniref:Uncharacterized protein n=1 Tax=Pyrodictium delaneyi TaxID=1273541 RepID=A0A0P0N1J6_9CREN|nr:hypothetical protein [Pyrodictium delaneyi]ALL00059.1 hypothetical protein Pyrde_0009 [Pyrodictium delaneyi]
MHKVLAAALAALALAAAAYILTQQTPATTSTTTALTTATEAATTATTATHAATASTATASGVTVVKQEQPVEEAYCAFSVTGMPMLRSDRLELNIYNRNCTAIHVLVGNGIVDKTVELQGAGSYKIAIELDKPCKPGATYSLHIEGLVDGKTAIGYTYGVICTPEK